MHASYVAQSCSLCCLSFYIHTLCFFSLPSHPALHQPAAAASCSRLPSLTHFYAHLWSGEQKPLLSVKILVSFKWLLVLKKKIPQTSYPFDHTSFHNLSMLLNILYIHLTKWIYLNSFVRGYWINRISETLNNREHNFQTSQRRNTRSVSRPKRHLKTFGEPRKIGLVLIVIPFTSRCLHFLTLLLSLVNQMDTHSPTPRWCWGGMLNSIIVFKDSHQHMVATRSWASEDTWHTDTEAAFLHRLTNNKQH